MFNFVVRRLHWLTRVPGTPHLFDALLLAWTAIFHRQRLRAMENVESEILKAAGVRRCAHRYGGIGFMRAGREFAHLHGNGLLDLHLGKENAQSAVANGHALPHHVLGGSAWVSYWIHGEASIGGALELLTKAAGLPHP